MKVKGMVVTGMMAMKKVTNSLVVRSWSRDVACNVSTFCSRNDFYAGSQPPDDVPGPAVSGGGINPVAAKIISYFFELQRSEVSAMGS